jgi:sialate O-acetylesterase
MTYYGRPLGDRRGLALPRIVGDNMVLQCEMPVPIWGWAAPRAAVAVSFAGQDKRTEADDKGCWTVVLDPLSVSHVPADMVIASGRDTITLTNVLVGEVWLCSGQSNMFIPVCRHGNLRPVPNFEHQLAAANYPEIRMCKVPTMKSSRPASDADVDWVVCSPETLEKVRFSAVGYFFGRELHRELNAPIGLIDSSWGGSRIELWTPPEGFDAVPSLTQFAQAARGVQEGVTVDGVAPSVNYYGMIHPLVPFALRGAIWYQGESNCDINDGLAYFDKMNALISGWRMVWGQGDFPFYYVQLPPCTYTARQRSKGLPQDPDSLPLFREAQTRCLSLSNTGMVVTTDLVDDVHDIHPPFKQDVGKRLALWALSHDYGRADLVFSGPLYKGNAPRGSEVVISFDHIGSGLISRNGKPLSHFELAGEDGNFVPADAVIDGDSVIVSSPQVQRPARVRFAWSEVAQPNLFNREGLPAGPFRATVEGNTGVEPEPSQEKRLHIG